MTLAFLAALVRRLIGDDRGGARAVLATVAIVVIAAAVTVWSVAYTMAHPSGGPISNP